MANYPKVINHLKLVSGVYCKVTYSELGYAANSQLYNKYQALSNSVGLHPALQSLEEGVNTQHQRIQAHHHKRLYFYTGLGVCVIFIHDFH